jgi:hypothetical protein
VELGFHPPIYQFYGPVKDNNEWRFSYNYELYALYEDRVIITFVIVGGLKSAVHIVRIDQQRPAKRILNAKPKGGRERGGPKLRWEDGVDNDDKAL